MSQVPGFIHLHAHSHYSLLEAPVQVPDLVSKAVDLQMPAVALTDLGNMFGAVEFYFACQKKEIKPLIGLEVYLTAGERTEKSLDGMSRIVLLAQNYEGYQNLCSISSRGFKEGFYYKPRVDWEVLGDHSENLIALSGGVKGLLQVSEEKGGLDKVKESVIKLKELYKDRAYVEILKLGVPDWDKSFAEYQQIAKDVGVKTVATNDVYFLEKKDQLAQEVLICVSSNRTLRDEQRYKLPSSEFYFKSQEQMAKVFSHDSSLVEMTSEIASRCDVKFKLEDSSGKPIYHLPSFPTTEGRTPQEEIKHIALLGLEKRVEEKKALGEEFTDEDRPKYLDRLDYELSVIHEKGFNGYFLIVQDFINWSKEQDIPVGPGRGSGAGSLVAFCLGITDLDPMPYSLIFERFLNPERMSMPDFDIDFCQARRGEVIDYVTQKYSPESVSQIITYGKLQTRAAIRDVGRVLGMTFGEVNEIARLVPDKLGITLDESLEMEPKFAELMETDPQIKTLIDMARSIEGLVRHAGIHAAGVIIADGNILDHAPLYRGSDGENVVQYDWKHSDKIGLIKFDFLGLKTLTHIQKALRLVNRNHNLNLKPSDISIHDPGIYEVMSDGDTMGVFQFEGEGITDLCVKAQPNCFEDIVALNALYRPGPMDMIPEYLKRKKGEVKVEYLFPELEPILKETYGIIIYQEHVQLIASKIANYTLGEADNLRRAMGKKIAAEMEKQRVPFLKGASENNHSEKKTLELFELMAEFAKYGFNKSHAAAYCVITAQTAWIKKYYPEEFYAALLSTEKNNTENVVKYVKDLKSKGIELVPPDINESSFEFDAQKGKVFFSLGAIKGVGEAAVEALVETRKHIPNGRFETLKDFFDQADTRKMNKKTLEALISAGAFDKLYENRAEMFENVSFWLEKSQKKRLDKEKGQGDLFAAFNVEEVFEPKQVVPLWSFTMTLQKEKEVLGFYLSGHPLWGLECALESMGLNALSSLAVAENKSHFKSFAMITDVRPIITKKGTRMAFVMVEGDGFSGELVVFPDAYAEYAHMLIADEILFFEGDIDATRGEPKVLAQSFWSVKEWIEKYLRSVSIYIDANLNSIKSISGLGKKLQDLGDGSVSLAVSWRDQEREAVLRVEKSKEFLFEHVGSLMSLDPDLNIEMQFEQLPPFGVKERKPFYMKKKAKEAEA